MTAFFLHLPTYSHYRTTYYHLQHTTHSLTSLSCIESTLILGITKLIRWYPNWIRSTPRLHQKTCIYEFLRDDSSLPIHWHRGAIDTSCTLLRPVFLAVSLSAPNSPGPFGTIQCQRWHTTKSNGHISGLLGLSSPTHHLQTRFPISFILVIILHLPNITDLHQGVPSGKHIGPATSLRFSGPRSMEISVSAKGNVVPGPRLFKVGAMWEEISSERRLWKKEKQRGNAKPGD